MGVSGSKQTYKTHAEREAARQAKRERATKLAALKRESQELKRQERREREKWIQIYRGGNPSWWPFSWWKERRAWKVEWEKRRRGEGTYGHGEQVMMRPHQD